MSDADRIRDLQHERLRAHRLEGKTMRDARQVRAFVDDRGIALWVGKAAIPNAADAIAGRSLRGSWMANPEVGLIYRLLSALDEYHSAPLILGKSTVLVADLGRALFSFAADPVRREEARDNLSPRAARLLALVEHRGEVRMDEIGVPAKESRPARVELERAFLVSAHDLHTERGSHTTILEPWDASALARQLATNTPMALADAEDALLRAGIRSAVIAPEREVRRWFDGSASAVDRALEAGTVVRLREGRDEFLASAELA